MLKYFSPMSAGKEGEEALLVIKLYWHLAMGNSYLILP